ncbi:hypothetical protein B0I32_115285 [Nonomuraea fuscirosea]|uniref:Uncharacterized protein n=1 Tax=Nonomuraea fuscirosea TaxID=1291556 RepID=A0A2T0MSI7_9ACTN|nr:hypothetical protein [Nonomuraea fuscirosea]PRX61430.1 hypothetical protein B0I32_115285 [Nonomuraea fuscirosea]
MGLTITDTHMTSDACPNTAELREGGWTVTGRPGRLFDHHQAITAMLLAELLALTAQADGPHVPTAHEKKRSDRTSTAQTADWDAASSAKTTTAPQHSTALQTAEVPSS